MTRVALYARVSTEDQDCARQFADLNDWAARMGATVVGRYHDTASGAKVDRWSRQSIMQDARLRKIDAILVTECSRWSRSTVDLLHSLDELASYDVSLRAMSGLDMDIKTPTGRLMVTILAGVAQFERELLRERTLSGLAEARRKGKVLGRKVGDEPTVEKHKDEVFQLREVGMSIRDIAKHEHISTTTVQKILRGRVHSRAN